MNLNRNKIETVDTQGLLRQLYCLKKCNELKSKYELDHNFKYDIVVRIRPDILPVYHSSIEPNVLSWNMNDYVYTSDHDNHFGYNDRLYFSNSSNMDLLSNRIDNLTDFIAKGGRLHYETFFKFCIDYTNLQVCRTRLMFVLLRNNGQISTELGNNISDIKLL